MIRKLAAAALALTISAAPANAAMCGDRIGATLLSVLQSTIDANRGAIEATLKQELGRGDLIARGYTLYDINVRLGQPLFTYVNGRLDYRLRANHIYAKSTMPTVLGSYADPAVQITFDILVYGQTIVPADGPPRADWIVAQAQDIVVDPRNVSGGVLTTITRGIQLTGPGGRAIQNVADRYLVRDLTPLVNDALAGAGFPVTRSAPVSGLPQTMRFTNPTYNCGGEVMRADWCTAWGADCGEAAALAYCTSRNFRMATAFDALPAAGRTFVPRDRRICEGDGCVSFRSITCSNAPPLTDSYVRQKKVTQGAGSSLQLPGR